MQVSQEADQVVWYPHFFQNFPQFIVIHIVKGFGIVNKAEIDVFLELSCFFYSTDYIQISPNIELFPHFTLSPILNLQSQILFICLISLISNNLEKFLFLCVSWPRHFKRAQPVIL